MKVLQHTRNKRNLFFKPDRADRNYRDRLLISSVFFNKEVRGSPKVVVENKFSELLSRRSIICLSLQLRKIIDLLTTDKSRYFPQPRPIIVNYLLIMNYLHIALTSIR